MPYAWRTPPPEHRPQRPRRRRPAVVPLFTAACCLATCGLAVVLQVMGKL